MTLRRIIWLSVLFLVLLTFWVLIPIDVYERSSMLYSFLGGALFFVCLFQLLGDFDSLYELFDKENPENVPPLRKLAPFAVIPGIIMIFVLVFHQSSRKSDELAEHGVLVKGRVTGGEASTTKRRGRSNTSYSINVYYLDSLKREYNFEDDVNSSEFNDLYEGAVIDVVYSRKHPSLARAVVGLDELAKYKKIPQEKIAINHLLAILEESVKDDSIVAYLNTISYEWFSTEKGIYSNEKMKVAINVSEDKRQLAYAQKVNFMAGSSSEFEKTLEANGFKKRASNVNGQQQELYYSDKYMVSKERKTIDGQSTDVLSMEVFEVYYVEKLESEEQ